MVDFHPKNWILVCGGRALAPSLFVCLFELYRLRTLDLTAPCGKGHSAQKGQDEEVHTLAQGPSQWNKSPYIAGLSAVWGWFGSPCRWFSEWYGALVNRAFPALFPGHKPPLPPLESLFSPFLFHVLLNVMYSTLFRWSFSQKSEAIKFLAIGRPLRPNPWPPDLLMDPDL